MKRILLTLVVILTVSLSFGQNKWQQKKIDYFVEAAVKEYNLNDEQKAELIDFRTKMVMDYAEAQKAKKSGEATQEETKKKNQSFANEFHNKFIKLTGKSYKELEPFLDRVRQELKEL